MLALTKTTLIQPDPSTLLIIGVTSTLAKLHYDVLYTHAMASNFNDRLFGVGNYHEAEK